MPYSSGTFSVVYDFTTEAASAPIEIAKLTEQFADIATGLSSVLLRDGTGLPTSNLPLNSFTFTGAGAATTLTGIPRVTELIDQDHIFYVDSGSANTLVITPSPAIAAYEEGQRFVVRATAANSGATTLNVNGLGAIAVQTPDGAALSSGAIVVGGIYEFTYDANASPDRWVLTSMPSDLPDAMLSANVPLLNAPNTFTSGTQKISATDPRLYFDATGAGAGLRQFYVRSQGGVFEITAANDANSGTENAVRITKNSAGEITDITLQGDVLTLSGVLSTPGVSAAEVGKLGAPVSGKTADHTIVAADAGNVIRCTSAADDITVQASGAPPAGCVVGVLNKTGGSIDIIQGSGMTLTLAGVAATTGSRTLADGGMAYVYFDTASTATVGGAGVA